MNEKRPANEIDLERILRIPQPSESPSSHVRTRVMAEIRPVGQSSMFHWGRIAWAGGMAALLAVAVWSFSRPPQVDPNVAAAFALPGKSTELVLSSLPRLEAKARSTYQNEWERMREDVQQIEGFVLDRFPRFAMK